MLALYFNFGVSIVKINNKLRARFKSLASKEHKDKTVEKNLRVTINFYKKHCFLVIT